VTVSADQNTHVPVNERILDHGKRSNECSANWTGKETPSQTGGLRKRPLARTGRLMLVDTGMTSLKKGKKSLEG